MPFVEETFTVTDLLSADEVLMTSTTAEVMPIVQIDDVFIKEGAPGEWTRKLQSAFEEEITLQCSSISVRS